MAEELSATTEDTKGNDWENDETNEQSIQSPPVRDENGSNSHNPEAEIGKKPARIKETDMENTRIMWAEANTKRGGEIESWEIFKRSNLEYQKVQKLLKKYFEVVRKKGNKNIYKWSPLYEVPTIDEPERSPLEENPKDSKNPERQDKTYQPQLPNFTVKNPNSNPEENN